MKKVKLKNDFYILGKKAILAGTVLEVKKHNTRFVYCEFLGCTLKLSIKDVEVAR